MDGLEQKAGWNVRRRSREGDTSERHWYERMANTIICTLFKLAFISCVFRNPQTLDSIPMKHELTRTFTSKLVTTLDVGVFNLHRTFVHSGENSMCLHKFIFHLSCYHWQKPIKFIQYWFLHIHTASHCFSPTEWEMLMLHQNTIHNLLTKPTITSTKCCKRTTCDWISPELFDSIYFAQWNTGRIQINVLNSTLKVLFCLFPFRCTALCFVCSFQIVNKWKKTGKIEGNK